MIGVPDEKWGETVKALVVLAPGARRSTEHELIDHCREQLAHYKCPTSDRVPRRAGPHGHRQAAEVQAARAVLGGPGPPGQLIPEDHLIRCARCRFPRFVSNAGAGRRASRSWSGSTRSDGARGRARSRWAPSCRATRTCAGIRDSKELARPERERAATAVRGWARAIGVGHASYEECDAFGMTLALRMAAERALAQLAEAGFEPDRIVLDGNHDYSPAGVARTPEGHHRDQGRHVDPLGRGGVVRRQGDARRDDA